MASIYKRKGSPYYWVKFRDPKTGDTTQKSTKLAHKGQADRLCLKYTLEEQAAGPARDIETWSRWVSNYLADRYGNKKLRAECAWRSLQMFLDEHKLYAPRQLLRSHAHLYLTWRTKSNGSIRKFKACRNTAIFELKFMSILMDEAVVRSYAPFNPFWKLRLRRDPVKRKPEFSRKQMAHILWETRKIDDPKLRRFFQLSCLIARYHGCRISETYLNPLEQVQFLDRPVITFHAKRNKIHTVFLHPKLIRRFRRMRRQGLTETYEQPKSPSKHWFKFLTTIGIKAESPRACHHSFRVTVATTLARNDVSKKKAMDYMGHASTTVHDSYVRLRADDLDQCAAAL